MPAVHRRLAAASAALATALVLTASPARATDTSPPTGSYTVDFTSAYTNGKFAHDFPFTRTALHDDTSADANITQEIDPGDGSGYVPWGVGLEALRVLPGAGTYHPTVRLTDEAGNGSVVDLPTVTLVSDTTPPTVHIRTPEPSVVTQVSAWERVRGSVHDSGSGVVLLGVIACERRSGIWYGYDYSTHKWVKGYAGLQKTLTHSLGWATYPARSNWGSWTAPAIRGLTKGTLRVEAFSRDGAVNASNEVVTQALTHS